MKKENKMNVTLAIAIISIIGVIVTAVVCNYRINRLQDDTTITRVVSIYNDGEGGEETLSLTSQGWLDFFRTYEGAGATISNVDFEDLFTFTEVESWYPDEVKNFLETEKRLLAKVKSGRMKLPSDSIDVLIVDEMGKNISGSGMDTKVIGRVYVTGQAEPKTPRVSRVVVLGLTEESHGNAIGIGLADFSTRTVLDKIDFAATAKNAVSSMAPAQGKIPCILENGREAIRAALDTAAIENTEKARVVRIQNTNQIARLYVSETLYEELKDDPEIRLLEGPSALEFDGQGNLKPGYYGKGDE